MIDTLPTIGQRRRWTLPGYRSMTVRDMTEATGETSVKQTLAPCNWPEGTDCDSVIGSVSSRVFLPLLKSLRFALLCISLSFPPFISFWGLLLQQEAEEPSFLVGRLSLLLLLLFFFICFVFFRLCLCFIFPSFCSVSLVSSVLFWFSSGWFKSSIAIAADCWRMFTGESNDCTGST